MNYQNPALSDAVREINDTSWLIAGKLMLTLTVQRPTHQPSWSDSHTSFYTVSKATCPSIGSRPIRNTDNLYKVYDAGGVSIVWRAGEAFIKLKHVARRATRKHITLRSLHEKGGFDFDIPKVFYHGEFGNLYCIVLSRIPGPTLAEAWPTLEEVAKQRYACLIANICDTFTKWQGTSISGVTGHQLPDIFFTKRNSNNDCDPQQLQQFCPGNIIVNNGNLIGILDWETAGFVPKEWVRTKFCISSGMDLPEGDETTRRDWRRRVSRELQGMGFNEVADQWMAWWDSP